MDEWDRRFSAFYEEHHVQLREYATRRFGANDADDIVQETMLRALDQLDRLTDGRPAQPWLRQVARRIAVDRGRRRGAQAVEADVLAELAPAAPDEMADVVIRVDVGGLLQRALRRLSGRDRQALTLREVHGFGIGEIAQLTGTTANTVRQRLLRARRNLARYYRELGGGRYPSLPPASLAARDGGPGRPWRITAALQRHATEPTSKLAQRAAAAAVAVVVAGVTLTAPAPAPRPPDAAAPRLGGPAVPHVPTQPAGLPAQLPGAGQFQLVAALHRRAPLAGSGAGFVEQWQDGLAGWTVTGRIASPDCRSGLTPTCVRLDPRNVVELTRRHDLRITRDTTIDVYVGVEPQTGPTTFALLLDLPGTTVTVSVAATDDERQLTVSSSAGSAARPTPLPDQSWYGLKIRLDPTTQLVTVSEVGNHGPAAEVQVQAGARLDLLRAIRVQAHRPAGAGGPVWLGQLAASPTPECADGVDNDRDGNVDLADDGCRTMNDSDEATLAACNDGVDNDGDGHVDYPDDPGCSWQYSEYENPACDNGVDDDGDGNADYPDDPQCESSNDIGETPTCSDGWDNDGDKLIDLDDPGCSGPSDDTEWSCVQASVSGGGLAGVSRVESAGLCADPLERIANLQLVQQAPAARVAGYVDMYRFRLPDGTTQDLPCVALRTGRTTATPCTSVGGTFVARVAQLVDAAGESIAAPGTAVDICTATLMLLATGDYTNPFDRRSIMLTLC